MSAAVPQVRQRTEDYERASLSSFAAAAVDSKGRERVERPDDLRTAFQQDRDRVLASGAFRRLAGKTQSYVVLADRLGGRRERSRLDHALDVAQVARALARPLRLNEDLVDAIATAHDVGNPAFGPAGEEALAFLIDPVFRHAEQSVRVVDVLEADGRGLNLTWEVRDGILCHSRTATPPATLEGQAVQLACTVVTASADLDHAVAAGIVDTADVATVTAGLGPTHGARVDTVVRDAVEASMDRPEVTLSPRVADACATMAHEVEARVHARPDARHRHATGLHCLQSLAVHLLEVPEALPVTAHDDPLPVRVADELSQMTDARALEAYDARFRPGPR